MNRKTKVGIIGYYGDGKNNAGGQEAKTVVLTNAIVNAVGRENVSIIDTANWRMSPFRLLAKTLNMIRNSTDILVLPAVNGVRVFAPLLYCGRLIADVKLHYIVIGGWLDSILGSRKMLTGILKTFSGIYVETQTMKASLDKRKFHNVFLMPNCKNITPLSEGELNSDHHEPYRLCTFSRVMKEKGIEDAINAVKALNDQMGHSVYTLDIYGQIDAGQEAWFKELSYSFPPEIRYCGVVPFDKSVEALKNYFALLFPTRFWTEGIPGTVIDAYAAGVPVIASRWESFDDLIDHGITGIGYTFDKPEELRSVLMDLVMYPEQIYEMKINCIAKAQQYLPEVAVSILLSKLS